MEKGGLFADRDGEGLEANMIIMEKEERKRTLNTCFRFF